MAYLPFYVTPEEFREYQQQQELEIKEGENLIEWEAYNIEMPNRYTYHLFVLAVMIPAVIFTYFVGFWSGGVGKTIISIFVILFIYGIAHLTFSVDYHFTYSLSSKGFMLSRRRNMPKWMNKAVQITAWCAALFCILMVGFAGPMILAGAGGAILLAFGMLKKQPDEPTDIITAQPDDLLSGYYNSKRKVIALHTKKDSIYFKDTNIGLLSRSYNRGVAYIFFSNKEQLINIVERFEKEFGIRLIEEPNHKLLFDLDFIYHDIKHLPSISGTYLLSETENHKKNSPLPEEKYIFNNQWYTKQELEAEKLKLADNYN